MGRSFLASECSSQTRASQRQQLGHAGQVPVGVANITMAQVHRQAQDLGIELFLALSVPTQQAIDGEGMALIPSSE